MFDVAGSQKPILFNARQHAYALCYVVMANLSICLSVTLLDLNSFRRLVGGRGTRGMTVSFFSSATAVTKFQMKLQRSVKYMGVGKFAIFDRNRRLSIETAGAKGPCVLWSTVYRKS